MDVFDFLTIHFSALILVQVSSAKRGGKSAWRSLCNHEWVDFLCCRNLSEPFSSKKGRNCKCRLTNIIISVLNRFECVAEVCTSSTFSSQMSSTVSIEKSSRRCSQTLGKCLKFSFTLDCEKTIREPQMLPTIQLSICSKTNFFIYGQIYRRRLMWITYFGGNLGIGIMHTLNSTYSKILRNSNLFQVMLKQCPKDSSGRSHLSVRGTIHKPDKIWDKQML